MIDEEKIKQAVRLMLEGIGEDPQREGLRETPERIARMSRELFCGMGQNAQEVLSKTFQVDGNEMVLEKDIPFYSVCEHHMLPFFGKAHICYVPNGCVVGISKLARTVEVYARRLQIQERLTAQVADDMMRHLRPMGVLVMLEAEHMCVSMRGVKKPGSRTVTVVTRGCFAQDAALENRVLQLIK